jgi:hypothetical protein
MNLRCLSEDHLQAARPSNGSFEDAEAVIFLVLIAVSIASWMRWLESG